MQLTLNDIQQAWANKDPALVTYIIQLATQADPEPETPIREDALTFAKVIQTMHGYGTAGNEFQEKTPEEQYAWRVQQWQLLEAENAELPLPPRFKLYEIIFLLWQDTSPYARRVLLEVIRDVPLRYGPWRALKHIFKVAEANHDYALLGAIATRCDAEPRPEFGIGTLIYMRRRAWRYLKRLGQTLPAVFPEAAIHFLAAYQENTNWNQTWVANHIFYHQTRNYGWNRFGYISPRRVTLTSHRAFKETWQRSPEPLFRLLSMAQAEKIRAYACAALKEDFKLILRDVDPQWLINLSQLSVASPAIDNLIVWLLQNSPKLEQQAFRDLGLHAVVLALLESKDNEALKYAVQYAKSYARDLSVTELLRLAYVPAKELQQFIQSLLSERDPRQDIGLAAWAKLLCVEHHHKFVARILLKHFNRKELTLDWFTECLLHTGELGFDFAQGNLFKIHPEKTIDLSFFTNILLQLNAEQETVADFLCDAMQKLDLSQLNSEFIQTAILHPLTADYVQSWIDIEKIKPQILPLDFWQALAYQPLWETHPFIQKLLASDISWQKQLSFDTNLAALVRQWLADPRYFAAANLGLSWLMELVNREEAEYHDFALDVMTKAFLPADFAPTSSSTAAITSATVENAPIDLHQQTFLFTGKLKTMTRKEAEDKVTGAQGKNASGVTAKLHYLVIGDEGSPLYGNGRKGSKQVSAEKLIATGAEIKIISETAFLQMLSGQQREISTDVVLAGCEALWHMAVDKPDTPLSKFAIQYLRHHHPELCLRLTDRPVDPGAEIPASFATFSRFKPLFTHSNTALRNLALDYAKYEFATWKPELADLIPLAEGKYGDVREFVFDALLSEPCADNKRYHLDTSQLPIMDIYGLCEARAPQTRQMGMQLIQKYKHFQNPEYLFQLTESPDRELRNFVVRILWSLYRHYATTSTWQPTLPVMANLSKVDQAKRETALAELGTGLPKRPEMLPATLADLQQLLRRWLYELPPGGQQSEISISRQKPLSAVAAKKALIETFRDLALEDIEFAKLILPLFQTFSRSNGKMEQAACLVAVTRLTTTFPALSLNLSVAGV